MTFSIKSTVTPSLIVALAIGCLLALRVGSLAISESLEMRRPSVAEFFNASNERALVAIATRAFNAEQQDLDEARTAATQALRANPLSWRSLQLLAAIAELENERERARPLMRQSARINLRNDANQAWELHAAIDAKDPAGVVALIGRLYALEKRFRPMMVGRISGLLADDDMVTALANALGENPEWRASLLRELSHLASDIIGMTDLYSALAKTPHPPTPAELGRHLNALIGRGWIDQAHALWAASLPAGRRERSYLLDNADFAYGFSDLPFDWSITPNPRANVKIVTEKRRRIVRIEYFGGRAPLSQISRLLALPPGKYVFSGLERAVDFKTPRGLAWRISCVGADAPLAQTKFLKADAAWQRFSMAIEIPSGCSFQTLELALLARAGSEQEISGTVAYADLSLEAVNDHAKK